MKSERIRNRNRLTTKLFSNGHSSTSESIFHEIDNLDTKTIEQAEDNYQEVFIRIRELLTGKPWCCDNEADTLSICQIIADDLRSNLLIRKEDK